MAGITSVTVYCGSAHGVEPAYTELARQLGAAIARRGWRLVYGGGNVGLMGESALSAHRSGGKVLGVMPHFLKALEGTLDGVEHIYVETMHQRKQIMIDEADAFVVLPGGIGTLEEAIETLSWAKLSLHRKPMSFLSTNGYWTPFFNLIDHVIDGGFAPASFRNLLADTMTADGALNALTERYVDIA